jgi:hypothetical protein
MGTCLTLFVLSWAVIRYFSVGAAVGMSVVAMVIPPFAAIVANRRDPGEKWFDEDDGQGAGPDAAHRPDAPQGDGADPPDPRRTAVRLPRPRRGPPGR